MEPNTLEEVYELAEKHAERGRGKRENYIDTFEGSIMVEGMEVQFHIDNSPAVYYSVGDLDDLVYVDEKEDGPTSPLVSESEFIERVQEIAEEERERFT